MRDISYLLVLIICASIFLSGLSIGFNIGELKGCYEAHVTGSNTMIEAEQIKEDCKEKEIKAIKGWDQG